MLVLAAKQAAEEAELLGNKATLKIPNKFPSNSLPSTPPSTNSDSSSNDGNGNNPTHQSLGPGGPQRSRSGNDLEGFLKEEFRMTRVLNGTVTNKSVNGDGNNYTTQSVPGSRRHSGESNGLVIEGLNKLSLDSHQYVSYFFEVIEILNVL